MAAVEDAVDGALPQASIEFPKASTATCSSCRNSIHSDADGMRREWNFLFAFVHRAARLQLQCAPQWEFTHIDPAEVQQLHDVDTTECSLIPLLRYTDVTAVMSPSLNGRKVSAPPDVGRRATGGGAREEASLFGASAGGGAGLFEWDASMRPSFCDGVESTSPLPIPPDASVMEGFCAEKLKHVSLYYTRVVAGTTTLRDFCVRCVQFILAQPHVYAVDGNSDLQHLRLGRKLACPHRLGGLHRCFHFYFSFRNKLAQRGDTAYALGTVVHERGYLFTVRCADEEELRGYTAKLFLLHYANPLRLQLDAEVHYQPVASVLLEQQQELFGELLYGDRDAAIAFACPMHPLRIRPDFSPAKTVGFGSITCMTLEIHLIERLLEDAAVAALGPAVALFKDTQVVLCLDVEDVTRMGYPAVLSAERYAELKTERLLGVFPDAVLIGRPTSMQLGQRAGSGRTLSFAYEPMKCTVKAMSVSTLVGSYGVTALYLTRLGGGAFDTYLYLYQQLLGSVRYFDQSGARYTRVSRHVAPNLQLIEADLHTAYARAESPEGEAMLAHHLRLMGERETACDAKPAEGAGPVRELLVPPEEGGLQTSSAAASSMAAGGRPSGLQRWAAGLESLLDGVEYLSSSNYRGGTLARTSSSAAAGSAAVPLRSSVANSGSGAAVGATPGSETLERWCETSPNDAAEGRRFQTTTRHFSQSPSQLSLHSQSLISISDVAQLQDGAGGGPVLQEDADGSEAGFDDIAAAEKAEEEEEARPEAKEEAEEEEVALPSRRADLSGSWDIWMDDVRCRCPTAPLNRDRAETREACIDCNGGPFPLTPLPAVAPAISPGRTCNRKSLEVDSGTSMPLPAGDSVDLYVGPSLRDVYVRCCDLRHCRANSHLLSRLPTDPQLSSCVEVIDLTSNYLGRNGFIALLKFLEHLPSLRCVVFGDMSLDNVDVEHLCSTLAWHPAVTTVSLKNNPKITLPAARHLSKLLQRNPRITTLELRGTQLGEHVVKRLERAAAMNTHPEFPL